MLEWKSIGTICSNVFAGGTPSTKHLEYYDGTIPWIRSGEIDFNVITKAERNITELGYKNSSAKKIRPNSVVMAMTGATVAKSAVVEIETTANQSVCAMETDESVVNYKYLFYYLAEEYFAIKSSAQGALTSLNLAMIKQTQIPIPSLTEQTRIVGILDTFTASIENLKQQIAQRRKQYEHYRDQLLDLEGKEGVEMKTLGEVCVLITGGEVPDNTNKGQLQPTEDHPYAVYTNGKEVYGFSNTYQVDADTVCISSIGANTGAIFYKTGRFTPAIRLKVLLPKEGLIPKYLFYACSKIDFRGRNTGSVPNINANYVKGRKLFVPSFAEQQRIISILDTFEASIANLEQQLAQRERQYEYYRNKLLTFE